MWIFAKAAGQNPDDSNIAENFPVYKVISGKNAKRATF